jgi:hypothetical protein
MVSTYGYLTLANLEKFTGIDYSTIQATYFADANVEMNISTAEELVNAYLGVSTAQTITNAITLSTKFLTGWLLNNRIVNLGYGTENTNPIFELSWIEITNLVKEILEGDEDIMVTSIPMTGASYRTPDSRMFL